MVRFITFLQAHLAHYKDMRSLMAKINTSTNKPQNAKLNKNDSCFLRRFRR